jgi:hypothetical protein
MILLVKGRVLALPLNGLTLVCVKIAAWYYICMLVFGIIDQEKWGDASPHLHQWRRKLDNWGGGGEYSYLCVLHY